MKDVINVRSEIAPLKTVLLHRPGREFLNLTPNTLQRLLFDDIPDLEIAQKEHDAFANALRKEGVSVVYLVDLVAEALNTNINVREKFIKQFIKEGGITSKKIYNQFYELLNAIKDNKKLVSKCIEGIDDSELDLDNNKFYRTRDIGKMVLDPLPNLYAPRDPFATIGRGVSLHHMHSVTRCRETIFGEYIFKYHPKYKNVPLYYDRYDGYSIEGGDIQVLSNEVVCIGISERTEPDAISLLAKKILKAENFKYVLAIDIPDERSFMHLDTVMTRVDSDKFVVHAHVMDVSDVYELSLDTSGELVIKEVHMAFDKVLEKYLHINKVTLIKCGNGERIASEREQWSDGVNTLCIRPGVVIAYSRNHVTNDALRAASVKVIEIPSSELSRGRGGPHCMSMALYREE
mgnify:FL=1